MRTIAEEVQSETISSPSWCLDKKDFTFFRNISSGFRDGLPVAAQMGLNDVTALHSSKFSVHIEIEIIIPLSF